MNVAEGWSESGREERFGAIRTGVWRGKNCRERRSHFVFLVFLAYVLLAYVLLAYVLLALSAMVGARLELRRLYPSQWKLRMLSLKGMDH
jgi:hypothetical protein